MGGFKEITAELFNVVFEKEERTIPGSVSLYKSKESNKIGKKISVEVTRNLRMIG